MKQSVEKQIKSAFESWDNEKNTVGIDKEAVWSSIQTPNKNKACIITWYRVASIVIILLLIGALGYSYQINKSLQSYNNQLAEELNQNKTAKKSKIKKEVETKIIYKTQIKTVESAHTKTALDNFALKLEKITSENKILLRKLSEQELANNSLNDSISILRNKLQETNDLYAQQLKNIESKNQSQGLSIEINQEALLALSKIKSKNKYTINNSNKRFKITFKNNTGESETSAPLFKDFTMK